MSSVRPLSLLVSPGPPVTVFRLGDRVTFPCRLKTETLTPGSQGSRRVKDSRRSSDLKMYLRGLKKIERSKNSQPLLLK